MILQVCSFKAGIWLAAASTSQPRILPSGATVTRTGTHHSPEPLDNRSRGTSSELNHLAGDSGAAAVIWAAKASQSITSALQLSLMLSSFRLGRMTAMGGKPT